MPKKQTQPEAEPIEAPIHLSERGKALWSSLVPARVRSAGRMAALQTALEALDRADEAAAAVRIDGLTTTTAKTGAMHLHPLLRVERDNRALFFKILSSMHLEWSQLEDG